MAIRGGSAWLAIPFLLLAAGGARADDHCSGTLCDFYYGSSSSSGVSSGDAAAAPQAAPHVMTTPTNPFSGWFSHGSSTADTQPATAAQPAQQSAQQPSTTAQPSSYGNSFFHMGGGGVMNRNGGADGCGGTICDLVHGHASSAEADPEPTTSRDINGIPASSYEAAPPSRRESVEAVAAPEPQTSSYVAVAPLPKTAATCSRGKDPWTCYRH